MVQHDANDRERPQPLQCSVLMPHRLRPPRSHCPVHAFATRHMLAFHTLTHAIPHCALSSLLDDACNVSWRIRHARECARKACGDGWTGRTGGCPVFRTIARCICLKYRCPSVFSDSYETHLSQKSVPHRVFGQVQTVVILSGPGYDFRQGVLRGSSPSSADRMTSTYAHPVGSTKRHPNMATHGKTGHGTLRH